MIRFEVADSILQGFREVQVDQPSFLHQAVSRADQIPVGGSVGRIVAGNGMLAVLID
jgi:hypothetical protein